MKSIRMGKFEPRLETYIVFLHGKFFKGSFFRCIRKRVVKKLENVGVKVVPIKDIIKYQNKDNVVTLSFDDKLYPDTNELYVHLYNGKYYNDKIYSKKKIECEKEILFLLAGKLGVSKISYSIENKDVELLKCNASVNIKNINNEVSYEKKVSSNVNITGTEIYENRGAPVYILSRTLTQVDANIKKTLNKLESHIFSYDYYKRNPKIETFVYKRFKFKMRELEYTLDVDDITEKSFAVRSCFMQYGLGLSLLSNTTTLQKIYYKFEFFSDIDLRIKLAEIFRRNNDKFIDIRETYDNSNVKENALYYIYNYVFDQSKLCLYELNGENFNYYGKVIEFSKTNPDLFKKICENFISTAQIRYWIDNTFTDENAHSLINYIDIDFSVDNMRNNINEDSNNQMFERGTTTKNISSVSMPA